MGRSEYHRHCRQLGVGQDLCGHGNHQVFKSAMGGDSCNGTEHCRFKDKEKETLRSWHLTLCDRIRSTRAWVLMTMREPIATNMILIVRMLWISMHWCKRWRTWSKGIEYFPKLSNYRMEADRDMAWKGKRQISRSTRLQSTNANLRPPRSIRREYWSWRAS